MRKATLTRQQTSAEGTFGQLVTDSGFSCHTGELPYRENAPGRSCIPAGVYPCEMRYSDKHRANVYHVDGVKGRSDIEIHSANWMGDTAQGFKCQLLGCIAPGREIGYLEGQLAMIASKDALAALQADLVNAEFELTISWVNPLDGGIK